MASIPYLCAIHFQSFLNKEGSMACEHSQLEIILTVNY
jgi:hypothetical protein